MPKYLFKVSYTTQGARGVAEEGGTGRRDAAKQITASSGGNLEAFYFAFGEDDAYVIADLPDNEAAAAVALAVNRAAGPCPGMLGMRPAKGVVLHELLDLLAHGRERVLTDLGGSSLARTNRSPGCRSFWTVNTLRSQPCEHGGDDRNAY